MSKKNRRHNGQKQKVQKDKQRSTKHKTKDQVTRAPLRTGGGELRCSGRVRSSCSTSATRRGNLVHAKKLPPVKFCKHPTEPITWMITITY